MKKKYVVLAISMMGALLMVGCGDKTDKQSENTTQIYIQTDTTDATESGDTTDVTDGDTTEATESGDTTEKTEEEATAQEASDEAVPELDEAAMRALIKENINCNLNIFANGNLMPVDGEYDEATENLVQVDPSEFADWDSFEAYVRSVYVEKTADMYLYNYPLEGQPRYVNQDGKLYLNLTLCGGKGYYVDWTDYQIEVTSSTDKRVEVKLTATVEWPADEPVKEPYEANGAFVYENGKWLLEDMIY